jgi:hypothetical protein
MSNMIKTEQHELNRWITKFTKHTKLSKYNTNESCLIIEHNCPANNTRIQQFRGTANVPQYVYGDCVECYICFLTYHIHPRGSGVRIGPLHLAACRKRRQKGTSGARLVIKNWVPVLLDWLNTPVGLGPLYVQGGENRPTVFSCMS